MTFGQRLRQIRQELGWSQEQLSDAVGVGLRSLVRYENDQAEPSMTTLVKIAKTLHISADKLLGLLPPEQTPSEGELFSLKERYAVEAWRRGNKLEAIQIIVNDTSLPN